MRRYIWPFFIALFIWFLILILTWKDNLGADGNFEIGYPIRMYVEYFGDEINEYIRNWYIAGIIQNTLLFVLIFLLLIKIPFKVIASKLKQKQPRL